MLANVPTFAQSKPRRRRRNKSTPNVVVVTTAPTKPKTRKKKVSGRGAYFEEAGQQLGGRLGWNAGGYVGKSMDGLVSSLLGRGEYTVRKNSIMNSSSSQASLRNDLKRELTEVFHREFIGDVVATGSTAWSITNTYTWNAGLAEMLPYLAQIGINFEETEWFGLVLVYEATSGNITTSQGLGSIQIATQYDMSDSAFTQQVEMLDYEYSTTDAPFNNMIHPVECDPKNNQLGRFYNRAGLIPGTTTTIDPRYNAYDIGRTAVAVAGVPAPAGTVLGKLFAVYHVGFAKSKLYSALGLSDLWYRANFSFVSGGGGVFPAAFTTFVPNTNSLLSMTVSGVQFSFPQNMSYGSFLISISFAGGAANSALIANLGSITRVNGTGTIGSQSNSTTAPLNNQMTTYAGFNITNVNSSFTLVPSVFTGSAGGVTFNGTIRIYQVNPASFV
jgi:hypothetical protein